jgi:peptidoglycan/LPS O-acetylase OafA/YrhL
LFALLIASAHPASGALNYFRPYIAAALVGSTLLGGGPQYMTRQLNSGFLAYVAQISFAVYLIHGIATSTWLGSGETIEKYAKRPLLLAVTFALAHLSTFHFERYFMERGRRLIGTRSAARI